jgi:Flp pilus assembly CpaF family ATPase
MLRTALGASIAAWLDDTQVVEVMLNPDGRLWIDRLGSGLADSKKSRRPSAGNSSSIRRTFCRRASGFSSSVRRRPIWLSSRRISGLVRLMSEGGTTR